MTIGPDRFNRETWGRPTTLSLFARRRGFVNDGEARALLSVADEVRGRPLLDLGVGAGRTVPLLRLLSHDYVALDYVEELVALARSRHPDVRIEHGDARDLSRFADAAFALVLFSFNGLDGVGHDDRAHVLAEVYRVLEPGGRFVYSTHNLDFRLAVNVPWRRSWRRGPLRSPGGVVRAVAGLPHAARRLPGELRSYRRSRPLLARGGGWAMHVDPAYGFGLVLHYVTVDETLRELRAAGFAAGAEVYDEGGNDLLAGADTRECAMFNVVARKPVSA